MGLIPYNPTDIKALRDELKLYGIKLSQESAWQVLRKIGDRHLAIDAILMPKRPKWLSEMIGD